MEGWPAVSESDYVRVSNLARIRAASSILRDYIPFSAGDPCNILINRAAIALDTAAGHIAELVVTTEDDPA